MSKLIFVLQYVFPVVVIGAVLFHKVQFVVTLVKDLRRAFGSGGAPVAAEPVAAPGGWVSQRFLARLRATFVVVSTASALVTIALFANQIGLWDDGLVDAKAKVVGTGPGCVPRETGFAMAEAVVACPATVGPELVVVDAVELAYVDAFGRPVDALARRSLFEGRALALGDRVEISFRGDRPTEMGQHLHQRFKGLVGVPLFISIMMPIAAIKLGSLEKVGAPRTAPPTGPAGARPAALAGTGPSSAPQRPGPSGVIAEGRMFGRRPANGGATGVVRRG